MGTEDDLQQLCLETFKEHYKGRERLQVDKQVPIIKDCTFVPEEGTFTLYFGHIKGDIVLYRQIDSPADHFTETDSFKPWWQNGDDELNIPFAVIEIKRGDSATTGAIRSKNEDARELRNIFPFVGYFFVADETDMETQKFYRASKRFDGSFITDGSVTVDWVRKTVIENGIDPHLNQLEGIGVL